MSVEPRPPAPPEDLGGGLWIIDTGHMGLVRTVGVYLQELPDGRGLLIEAGPGSTVEAVQDGLRTCGVGPGDLAGIVLTHIHLDHAGGAGALARWADAPVWVHPVGRRHLIDPGRLMASAARIYGDQMERLWGEMLPVPEEGLRTLEDGDTLQIGGRSYTTLHTPGHARHHLSLMGPEGEMFVGDAAGIRMPGFELIRPALPPPETDLEAAEASCRRMAEAKPDRLLLTHFGAVRDAQAHLAAVPVRNRLWAQQVREGLAAGEDDDALVRRMERVEDRELEDAGVTGDAYRRYKVSSDATMTVMGLGRYWRKRDESGT